jgi:hypothetical protein
MKSPIVFFTSCLVLGMVFGMLVVSIPSKWDQATVLRICRDGTPIVQLADGSVWARRTAFLAYRVERKPEEICE